MEKNDEIHDNTQKCKCNINLKELICLLSIPIIILFFLILGICICNNSQPKSILASQVTTNDPFVRGFSPINFYANTIKVGNDITHEEGSTDFILNSPGIYQISYQIFGERQTFGTYNFNAVILVNGVVLDDTQNETPILKDNVINRMTKTSTVILRLNAGDTLQLGTITVEDIIFDRARIDIEKIY